MLINSTTEYKIEYQLKKGISQLAVAVIFPSIYEQHIICNFNNGKHNEMTTLYVTDNGTGLFIDYIIQIC